MKKGLFSWISGLFIDCSEGFESNTDLAKDHTDVNPATGLVMVGGLGGVDTAGNPYGTDLNLDSCCDLTTDILVTSMGDFSNNDHFDSSIDEVFNSSFDSDNW